MSGSFHGDGTISVDGDFDVSGSAKTGGDFEVSGVATVSGSMKVDGNINAKGGIRVYGSGKADGNLFSENEVEVKGSVKVDGNVTANKVKFTTPVVFKRLLRRRNQSQIDGNILGIELVEIENIQVDGDVRGRVVKIGRNSKIDGTVYYVDDLQVSEDVELENESVRISEADLGAPFPSTQSSEIPKVTVKTPAKPKFCPKCGQEIEEGLKFCPACGAGLD